MDGWKRRNLKNTFSCRLWKRGTKLSLLVRFCFLSNSLFSLFYEFSILLSGFFLFFRFGVNTQGIKIAGFHHPLSGDMMDLSYTLLPSGNVHSVIHHCMAP